jgi:aryl-alcohol dehydrogenase-like predicted oxidoreductase
MNVSPQLTRAAFLSGIAGFASAVALAGATFAQPSEDTMQTRPIPASGKALPVIGVGTWQTFDVGASAAERIPLAEVLRVLFEAGGSVIDSSPMYGKAQGVVGELLTASRDRDKAFIATKVWTTGRQAGIDQMRHSMGLLGTDHIELMQVHNLVDWRTQLATLRAWKEEKRITYLGMTHYTASGYDQLEAVMRSEPLDFVQLDYAIDDRGVEQRLLPLAVDRGIAILVNQPFGGGGLIRKLSAKPLPDWAGEIGCRSWAQILLKFVLGHPAVTCVIPGTSKPEHMRDNVQAGRPPMPDAAMCARMAASF